MPQYRQRVIFASANIYPFVWSVWSEPDVLPYAFDTSEARVFCRGERTRPQRLVQIFLFQGRPQRRVLTVRNCCGRTADKRKRCADICGRQKKGLYLYNLSAIITVWLNHFKLGADWIIRLKFILCLLIRKVKTSSD